MPEYNGRQKNRRGPKPRIELVTTAGDPVSVSSKRAYSSTRKHEAFRRFAFDTGRRHLAEGKLGYNPLIKIIQEYKAANPSGVLPKSLKASIQWETFIQAVMQNNIDLLVLKRQRDPVRDVRPIQDKLLMRPELAPVVDWCKAWIRETHRQCLNPTFENMKIRGF
jgi:hypothetical protein